MKPWRLLKQAGIALLLVTLLLVVVVAGFGYLLSGPHYRGPVSDHFDGRRFYNPSGIHHRSFGEFANWMLNRKPGVWRDWTSTPPGPPPPRRVTGGRLRVTFVNHATTLIQVDGLNILTDPIWSARASPFDWIGPRRVRPPGIRFQDLPPIDVVLIEPGPIQSRFRENAYRAFLRWVDREHSAHRAQYEAMIQRLNKAGPAAPFTLGPDAVSRTVLHAFTTPAPRARYAVTVPTHVFAWLKRLLPTRLLDRVLLQAGGNGKR